MSAETLLDVFERKGMVGHSAALVAMTGAEDFLEEAMVRFTGLGKTQRSQLGQMLAFLMLDGHASSSRQEVFPPGRIPGLHEFQPRSVEPGQPRAVDPGSLLHAKIALLAFAQNRTGSPVHLRLAVFTANFTYTSANHQLELVWTVDVPLGGAAPAEDRVDVASAGAFVKKLLERRFHSDEHELPHELTARLDVLLEAASSIAPKNGKPRFIHSLDRPLYDQIRERFRSGIDKPRNFLLCGSGFYEERSKQGGKPKVFQEFDKLMQDRRLFTANARRVALVEPEQAGAVAAWASNNETDGWKIVKPFDAPGHGRRLHAKFVYAGYLRDGGVSNGWLYLGSGNLSRRGILTHGAMDKGNIETGVVFAVDERLNDEEIKRSLFWAADDAETPSEWADGQAEDAPEEKQPILEAPPILSARIEPEPAKHLHLFWREDAPAEACISWTGRDDWFDVKQGDDVPLRDDENPIALHVALHMRGENEKKWVVPVVDAAGRVGWRPPRFDTYADALAALLDFPIRPGEETDDDEGGDGDDVTIPTGKSKGEAIEQEKIYALHTAAEFVEQVAALQAVLPESMLDDWLDHLDRMLRASFPEELIGAWREHNVNVFAHLREPELRSPHLTDKQRARYFEALDGAARAWGLQ